jgi:23S rRNA (guanosine2251-2'-O)-methyltransferase
MGGAQRNPSKWDKQQRPGKPTEHQPSLRPKKDDSEILYGINPVHEAMMAGRRKIVELMAADNRPSERLDELIKMALSRKITVKKVAPAEISRVSGTDSHQNVAARVSGYPFSDLDDIIQMKNASEPPFLLILDGIEDPMNLGALARTALGAGVDGIIIPKDRAASPTPSASKASAGALEHIRVVQVTNIVNTIKDLKKEGIWITGLDAEALDSLYECDFKQPSALVIGGEGRGVRELVKKHCDYLVFIPQQGPVNSLNASVAGALTMYEVVRQRRAHA